MLVIFIIILLTAPLVQCGGYKRGFLLTGPAAVTPGGDETYCATFHHVTGSARGILDLTWGDGTSSTVELQWTNVSLPDLECFKLSIPLLSGGGPEEEGRLRLRVYFGEELGYSVDGWGVVALAHSSRPSLAIAETDLPVYRPDDLVRVRVLLIRPADFAIVQSVIHKIWLLNPSYLKVAQWNNVTTRLGLAELQFRLSSDPQQGIWRIKVLIDDYQKQEDEITFEVRHHVLSKFHLSIQHVKEMTYPSDYYSWKICSRYSYGKPVKGVLNIQIKAATESGTESFYNETISEDQLDGRRGCLNYSITALQGLVLGPGVISLNATMIESATGNEENASTHTKVSRRKYDVKFINTDKYFKYGLGFSGQVQVTSIGSNTPKSDVSLKICFETITTQDEENEVCRSYKSNRLGLVIFRIAPLSEDITIINIRTQCVDEKGPSLILNPWSVQSSAHISVSRPPGIVPLMCGIEYDFPVIYTAPDEALHAPQIMHYIVKTRGGIASRGSVFVPSSSTAIPDRRDVPAAVKLNPDLAPGRRLARVSLRVRITSAMAPEGWFVVYYARGDGELVSGSTRFEVQRCYGQKVHQSWIQSKAYPGDAVTLRLRAAPNSLCAISTVDGRVKQLTDSSFNRGGAISSDLVYGRIIQNAASRKTSVMEDIECLDYNNKIDSELSQNLSMSDSSKRKRRGISNIEALGTFQNADLVVITDLDMKTLTCIPNEDDIAFRLDSLDGDGGIPSTLYQYSDSGNFKTDSFRDYFPDSWLWELIHIGSEGKQELTYQLPHTLTTWHSSAYCLSESRGLGVATPSTARITAFQPFFVDIATPYSIKRGEIVELSAQVFNYQDDSLPVSLSITAVDGLSAFMFDGGNISSKCVPSNDAAVFAIQLRATELGKFNLTLTAQVDTGYPESCGPETLMDIRDTLVKQILVEPEGFPVEITKSAFLCPKEFPEESSLTWSWELPNYVVEQSAKAQISVIGELVAPILQNLGNLVQLPLGCGEQNMILFVPNLYVLTYLDANRIENEHLRSKALYNLKIGYERQLNYRHKDGGYSAFGEQDESPSTWLTAFVLRTFAQLQRHIDIDKNDLMLSRSWLMSQQLENGCFQSTGYVFNSAMKGGLEDEDLVGLTAFVLISLIETRLPVKRSSISSARFCIGSVNGPGVNADLYTLGLATYAYSLLGPQKKDARSSLARLLRRATSSEGMLYWQSEDDHLAVNIEITSYAILALVKHGGRENMAYALQAVKYLSRHRNSHGGFVSTQDTNVALQALAEYANSAPLHKTNITVGINSNNIIHSIPILSGDPLSIHEFKSIPKHVTITSQGDGCVVIQGSLMCNVRGTAPSKSFSLEVRAKPLSRQLSCSSIQNIRVCTWLRLRHVAINMAVLEVMLPTGYEPDRASLFKVQQTKNNMVKRFEEQPNLVLFYLINLPTRRVCLDFLIARSQHISKIENAKPAHVRIYDYYKPDITTVKSYLLTTNCENNTIPMYFEMDRNTETNDHTDGVGQVESTTLANFATNYNMLYTTIRTNTDYSTRTTEVDREHFTIATYETQEMTEANTERNEDDEEEDLDKYSQVISEYNKIDCPKCYVGIPLEFPEIYCNAVNAFYSNDGNTILMDFNPKKREFVKMNLTLNIEIADNCDCKPFFRAGAHLLVMDHGLPFLDILHPDSTLVLGSSSHILGLGPVTGNVIPSRQVLQRIRRVRQMCKVDKNDEGEHEATSFGN